MPDDEQKKPANLTLEQLTEKYTPEQLEKMILGISFKGKRIYSSGEKVSGKEFLRRLSQARQEQAEKDKK